VTPFARSVSTVASRSSASKPSVSSENLRALEVLGRQGRGRRRLREARRSLGDVTHLLASRMRWRFPGASA
jgi:hypothetical protein